MVVLRVGIFITKLVLIAVFTKKRCRIMRCRYAVLDIVTYPETFKCQN